MEKLKSLDLKSLEKRITKTTSTKEALRDVTPFAFKFNKDKITYHVIGQMKAAAFNDLIDFINNGDFEIEAILDNL